MLVALACQQEAFRQPRPGLAAGQHVAAGVALHEVVRHEGPRIVEADVRARTVYLVQIGYIAMQVRETPATRMGRIPAYVKTFAGQAPADRELARFYARFGYRPGS